TRPRVSLLICLTVAVVALAAVAAVVAWKLYTDAKTRALTDLRARTVAVGSVIDQAFAGDVATLSAVAKAPAFLHERRSDVQSYLVRAFPKSTSPFTSG